MGWIAGRMESEDLAQCSPAVIELAARVAVVVGRGTAPVAAGLLLIALATLAGTIGGSRPGTT